MENGALHDQLRDEKIVDVKKGISLKPKRETFSNSIFNSLSRKNEYLEGNPIKEI